MDFAKAFDSVPHCRLLLKLESLGIGGKLLSWLEYFLTKRFQRVVIDGSYSEWLPVRSGVPQSSILGPLLFLLYLDDIHYTISHSSIQMFADDVALYKEITTESDSKLLQEDLDSIVKWSHKVATKLKSIKV